MGIPKMAIINIKIFRSEAAQGAIANSFGMLIGIVNAMWLMPLLFSIEEIGFYRWVERTGMFLAQIGLFGLHRVYIKFHSLLIPEERRGLLNQILLIFITVTVTLTTLLKCFELAIASFFKLQEYYSFMWVLGIMSMGTMAHFLGSSISSTTGAVRRPFIWRSVLLRILLFSTGILVYLQLINFFTWVQLQVLFTLMLGGGIMIWSLKLVGWRLALPWRYNGQKKREMFDFGLFNTFNSFLSFAIGVIDVQLIIYFLGVGSLGIFSLASFVAFFVDGIKRPLSQKAIPRFAELWNKGERSQIHAYYKRTALWITMVAVLSFIVVIPQLDMLFAFIPGGDRFFEAKPLIVYMLFARIVDYAFGYNGEVLANGPYYKESLIFSACMLIVLICTGVILIPRLGLLGAALSFLIVNSIFNVFKATYLFKKEGWHPFSIAQLKVILSGFAVFGASMYFSGNSILDVGFRIILCGVWLFWIMRIVFPTSRLEKK